jgi:hypothetical protein
LLAEATNVFGLPNLVLEERFDKCKQEIEIRWSDDDSSVAREKAYSAKGERVMQDGRGHIRVEVTKHRGPWTAEDTCVTITRIVAWSVFGVGGMFLAAGVW